MAQSRPAHPRQDQRNRMILDPRTASLATGVPVRTIQRWVCAGRITDHGDGSVIRVAVDELSQLVALRDARKGHRLPYVRTVT
jgi:hypothetical protein